MPAITCHVPVTTLFEHIESFYTCIYLWHFLTLRYYFFLIPVSIHAVTSQECTVMHLLELTCGIFSVLCPTHCEVAAQCDLTDSSHPATTSRYLPRVS